MAHRRSSGGEPIRARRDHPSVPLGITYGHSGFMPGYMTDLVYFPDLRVSVAVQVNTSVHRATGRPLRTFAIEFARIIAE